MSNRARVIHPIYNLLPTEIEGFDSLAELALDLHWSWNHATDEVWRQLDPRLWRITQSPWVVLQTVSRDQIERVLDDPAFRKKVDELLRAKRQAAEAPAWFQQNHSNSPLTCVAYFSMEFMLSEALHASHGCFCCSRTLARNPNQPVIAKISHETLAGMIGTTRSRVSFFMNQFRKMVLIDSNGGGMHLRSSLVNSVLHLAAFMTLGTCNCGPCAVGGTLGGDSNVKEKSHFTKHLVGSSVLLRTVPRPQFVSATASAQG